MGSGARKFHPQGRSTPENPMPGSHPRIRRPVLLLLVFGAFLALVGITATAQAAMVSAHFSAATLNDVVGSDAATIRTFVNAHLDGRYLDAAGGPSAAELTAIDEQLGTLTAPKQILRVEIRRLDGGLVAATDSSAAAAIAPADEAFALAAGGAVQADILPAAAGEAGSAVAGQDRLI